jgi:hypothetical protein
MLKEDYGIQPAIVVEVEIELMHSRRFGAQFVPELRKAVGNGTIEILNATSFPKFVPPQLAKGVFGNSQALGLEYNKYADRGEAYTLATAVTLAVPALSNDKTALDALDFNGMELPSPVLRAFDLFSFCYQTGTLDDKHCDAVRKTLMQKREHVPRSFQNASFTEGLKNFCPRMFDAAKPLVGKSPTPGPGYAAPMPLIRT